MRVDFPQFTEKSFITNLAIGLVAGLGLVEKDYYCEHCHCMWPKPAATLRAIPDPTGDPQQKNLEVEPANFRTFKWWRKLQGSMLSVCAAMLLLENITGLAASTNANSPADAVAVNSVQSNAVGEPNPAEKKSPAKSETPTYLGDVLPVFMSKCARCHGDPNSVLPNFLDYRAAFGDRTEIERRVWRSWKGSYYKQPMPAGNNLEAQTMTEDERRIIKQWVENGAPQGVLPTDSGFHSKAKRIELGKQLFGTACAICHQPAGQGIPTRFPPLAASDFLNTDKRRTIEVVVNGLQGELVVNGRKFDSNMPKLPLTDQEIANVLTYVYNSMGNSGKEVTPDEVSVVRAQNPAPGMARKTQSARVSEAKNPFE